VTIDDRLNSAVIPVKRGWFASTRAPIVDDELLRSIKETYRVLRLGLGWSAIFLPLTLWLVGLARGVSLQGSMSAYYHTDTRDVFVGVLFAAGAGLYLYRGFSRIENWMLNAAGLFAIGVALFPARADAGRITLHGICAVLFLCVLRMSLCVAPPTPSRS
jgi:hypothetical protein